MFGVLYGILDQEFVMKGSKSMRYRHKRLDLATNTIPATPYERSKFRNSGTLTGSNFFRKSWGDPCGAPGWSRQKCNDPGFSLNAINYFAVCPPLVLSGPHGAQRSPKGVQWTSKGSLTWFFDIGFRTVETMPWGEGAFLESGA